MHTYAIRTPAEKPWAPECPRYPTLPSGRVLGVLIHVVPSLTTTNNEKETEATLSLLLRFFRHS